MPFISKDLSKITPFVSKDLFNSNKIQASIYLSFFKLEDFRVKNYYPSYNLEPQQIHFKKQYVIDNYLFDFSNERIIVYPFNRINNQNIINNKRSIIDFNDYYGYIVGNKNEYTIDKNEKSIFIYTTSKREIFDNRNDPDPEPIIRIKEPEPESEPESEPIVCIKDNLNEQQIIIYDDSDKIFIDKYKNLALLEKEKEEEIFLSQEEEAALLQKYKEEAVLKKYKEQGILDEEEEAILKKYEEQGILDEEDILKKYKEEEEAILKKYKEKEEAILEKYKEEESYLFQKYKIKENIIEKDYDISNKKDILIDLFEKKYSISNIEEICNFSKQFSGLINESITFEQSENVIIESKSKSLFKEYEEQLPIIHKYYQEIEPQNLVNFEEKWAKFMPDNFVNQSPEIGSSATTKSNSPEIVNLLSDSLSDFCNFFAYHSGFFMSVFRIIFILLFTFFQPFFGLFYIFFKQ
jgi:hypothetical protein